MENKAASVDGTVGEDSTPVAGNKPEEECPESQAEDQAMPKKDKQVRGWSKKDVSRWLEKRKLGKFVALFQKHSVVGSDIVESRLSFLNGPDVMVADREEILAEIYMLLHPDSPKLIRPSAPSPSLRAVHPKDREKVEAAMQVASSPPSRHASPPVVLIGSRSRSPATLTPAKTLTSNKTSNSAETLSHPATTTAPNKISTPATTLTLPTTHHHHQRSKSESGVEAGGFETTTTPPPSPGRKYLKRKSTPALHDYLQRGTVQNASLFDTLEDRGPVCLHCVTVQRSEVGSKFGFSYQVLPDDCLLVTNVRSPDVPLRVGDRLLEMNGVLLPGHKRSTADSVLSKSSSLDIVVIRPPSRLASDGAQTTADQTKLQQQVVMSEVRWQSLRQLLTSLQHKSFDPLLLTGTLTRVEDMENFKKRAELELELEELQRRSSELSSKVNDLQTEFKVKEAALNTVTSQRDRAMDTLRSEFLNHCGPPRDQPAAQQLASSCGDKGDHPVEQSLPNRTVKSSQDLHNLFFEHIEVNLASMERSEATKKDVLHVLRELTQASKRHAQFVDRLLSFVLQRAPWMLRELHALQDRFELPPEVTDRAESPLALQSALRRAPTSPAGVAEVDATGAGARDDSVSSAGDGGGGGGGREFDEENAIIV